MCTHTHARTRSTAILQPYDEPNVSKLKTNKKHRNSQGRSQDFYSEKIPLPPPSPPLPSLPSFSPTSSSPSPFSLPPTLPSPLSPPFPQLLGDMGERCKLKTKKTQTAKAIARILFGKDTSPFPLHSLSASFPPPLLPYVFFPLPIPWVRTETADKRFLANLEHKIKHLTTTILTGFLIN